MTGPDPTTCLDVNECTNNHGGCDSLTACTNSAGSYACGACPPGYDGSGASGCIPHVCSGAPDSSCACIHVAPNGDDTLGAATGGVTPFASVQAAVDFAAAHHEHATNVCIAEGAACGTSATYPGPSASDMTMRNGVSVYGNYESSGWTRCTSQGTTLLPQTSSGVVFDASVQSATVLDGVTVTRFAAPTTSGITITGARGVTVKGVSISGGGAAANLFGIHVSGGAVAALNFRAEDDSSEFQPTVGATNIGLWAVDSQVTVSASSIFTFLSQGDTGVGVWLSNAAGSSVTDTAVQLEPYYGESASLLGIHVDSSSVGFALDDNTIRLAQTADFGATTATGVELVDTGSASLGTTSIAIRRGDTSIGLHATNASVSDAGSIQLVVATSTAYGAWLENAPGSVLSSPVVIESAATALGIHVVGDTTGDLFSGSVGINVVGQAGVTTPPQVGTDGTGISLSACGGSSAAVRSTITVARGFFDGSATGISADADCPADISSSITVQSSQPRWSQTLTGITCDGACDIHGSSVAILGLDDPNPNLPPIDGDLAEIDWLGVGSAAGKITGSTVNGLSSATYWYGKVKGTAVGAGAGAFVSSNIISGNCTGSGGAALTASGSRVENNVIYGPTCGYDLSHTSPDGQWLTSTAYGILSYGADVNSNAVHGSGVCDFPPQFPSAPADTHYDSRPRSCIGIGIGGDGTLRNNIVSGDVATTSTGVIEHNDLQAAVIWGPASPMDARPQLHTILEFEQFDPQASGNFSLQCDGGANSPCIDAGSKVGAPSVDFAGNPRDAYPDVGSLEWLGPHSACFGVDCSNHGVCLGGACQCDPAYSGASCNAQNSCAVNNGGCDPLTTCTGSAGGHTCGACPLGYTGDGASGCVDVDECQTNGGGCAPPMTCVNAPGTFSCVCPAGETNVNGTCLTNDCATNNGGCDALTTCTNTSSGHTCGACPSGYSGDGATGCTKICPCTHGGTCPSSGFNCICPPSFDGSDCDITFVAVSAGDSHVCALRSDKLVRCWGFDAFGETNAPSDLFTAVSVGFYHSCGILAGSGRIECWGQDTAGQADPPAGQFKAIASGAFDNCALGIDGTLVCWGRDGSGAAPTPPAGTFTQITGTAGAFCALDGDNVSTCFGQPPPGSPPPDPVVAVSTGTEGSCAVLLDGTLDCWNNGNLGPVPAGTFKSVAVGSSDVCALATDDTLTCFGSNDAAMVPPAGSFRSVSVGYRYACGIRANDALVCWGTDQGFGTLTPPY